MSALVGKKRASTAGKATKKRKAPAPAPAPAPVTPESTGNAGAPKNEVREDQVGRAVKALLDFQERKTAAAGKKAFLGEDEENIQLVLTLQRIPQHPSPKPFMLEIPHRLQGDGDREMCMFMKDAADKKKAKALVMEGENKVDGMAKIITLDKLRTDYKRFEQKRELLATYDMFLADDRILPMLCKELGKTFFSRKKQPVAIQVTRPAALKSYVEQARDSTYMFVSSGTCISITVGTTAMTKEELTANIMAVAPAAIDHVPKKWKNIQAVAVKTSTSDALPVFSKLPFSEMAIDAARADEEAKAAAAAEETKAEEPKEAAPTKKAAKAKGTKKALQSKSPLVQAKKVTGGAKLSGQKRSASGGGTQASDDKGAAKKRATAKRIGGLRGSM